MLFSMPFSEMHSSPAWEPLASQPQEQGPSHRGSAGLWQARGGTHLHLPPRPRLGRDSFSLPGSQPLHTVRRLRLVCAAACRLRACPDTGCLARS